MKHLFKHEPEAPAPENYEETATGFGSAAEDSAIVIETSADFAAEYEHLLQTPEKLRDPLVLEVMHKLACLRRDYSDAHKDILRHPEKAEVLLTKNGGDRYIFILVTRSTREESPTYRSLEHAFQSMRSFAGRQGIRDISMDFPQCPKLDQGKVRRLLQETFRDAPVQLHVRMEPGLKQKDCPDSLDGGPER